MAVKINQPAETAQENLPGAKKKSSSKNRKYQNSTELKGNGQIKTLSPQQQRFVEYYLQTLNTAQAANLAGYKSFRQAGYKLLKNPLVRDEINRRQKELAEKTDVTHQWIERRLVRVVDKCMADKELIDLNGKPLGEYVFDSRGATKALELLGKYKGMFITKLEHSGPGGGAIPVEIMDMSPEERRSRIKELEARLSELGGR